MGRQLTRITPQSDKLTTFLDKETVHVVMYNGEVWVGVMKTISSKEITLLINHTLKKQLAKTDIAEIIVDL